MMKTSGYWEHNEQMISDLGLNEPFKKLLQIYGANKDKAMTKTIKDYLEARYSSEKEELALIYDKISKYLGETAKA